MDFLRAIIGIVLIVAIIFFLSRVDHHKNPELYAYTWIGSIFVLLSIGWFL